MSLIESLSEDELIEFLNALEPLRGTSRAHCFVCGKENAEHAKLEEHHVWPREYGGTSYPTVMLCPEHHAYVHSLAVKVIAKISRSKPPPVLNISTAGSVKNVSHLVRIIITAWCNPTVRRKTLQVSFEDTDLDDFLVVKTLLSLSDKNTILYAVREVSNRLRGD